MRFLVGFTKVNYLLVTMHVLLEQHSVKGRLTIGNYWKETFSRQFTFNVSVAKVFKDI